MWRLGLKPSIYNLWGPRPDGSLTRPDVRCHISMRQVVLVRTCNFTIRPSEPHPFGHQEKPSGRSTLKVETEGKIAEKNKIKIPNVSFRTHMYNQLIKQ
jgi:hypothetical protein